MALSTGSTDMMPPPSAMPTWRCRTQPQSPGLTMTGRLSVTAQLGQKRKRTERVVVEVPVDVPDTQLRGLLQVGGDLLGRAEQRCGLVHVVFGDVAVHLKHHRQRVRVVTGGTRCGPEARDACADGVPVEDP